MPSFIVKLQKGDKDYYMEWSTIVDAPTTYGMSLAEFTHYYRQQFGEQGMQELPQRLARVEATGTSARTGETVEDLISGNRAGPGESSLTLDQLIEKYCEKREKKTR